MTPEAGAEWYFLVSGDPTGANRNTGQVNTLNHAFEPVPFGNDLYMQFGDQYGLPIIGNFDRPIGPDGEGNGGASGPPNEVFLSVDVNKDGVVSPNDVLQVVNHLNESGPGPAERAPFGERDLDANRDSFITPNDALAVINYINRQIGGVGEGEGEAGSLAAISLNSGIDRAAILAELGEGEASSLQFSIVAMSSYWVDRSGFEQTDVTAWSDRDGVADEVLASVVGVNRAKTRITVHEVRDELFAATDLKEELLDALANDVSGRQKRSDLDELFGDFS